MSSNRVILQDTARNHPDPYLGFDKNIVRENGQHSVQHIAFDVVVLRRRISLSLPFFFALWTVPGVTQFCVIIPSSKS
jgi:hypothetical protein